MIISSDHSFSSAERPSLPRHCFATAEFSTSTLDIPNSEDMVQRRHPSRPRHSKRFSRQALSGCSQGTAANSVPVSSSRIKRHKIPTPAEPASWPWTRQRARQFQEATACFTIESHHGEGDASHPIDLTIDDDSIYLTIEDGSITADYQQRDKTQESTVVDFALEAFDSIGSELRSHCKDAEADSSGASRAAAAKEYMAGVWGEECDAGKPSRSREWGLEDRRLDKDLSHWVTFGGPGIIDRLAWRMMATMDSLRLTDLWCEHLGEAELGRLRSKTASEVLSTIRQTISAPLPQAYVPGSDGSLSIDKQIGQL